MMQALGSHTSCYGVDGPAARRRPAAVVMHCRLDASSSQPAVRAQSDTLDSWTGSLRDLAARIREALPESVSRELPRLDVPIMDQLRLDVPRQIRAAPTHPYLGE